MKISSNIFVDINKVNRNNEIITRNRLMKYIYNMYAFNIIEFYLLNLLKLLALNYNLLWDTNLTLGSSLLPIGCFFPIALEVQFPNEEANKFSLIKPLTCPV